MTHRLRVGAAVLWTVVILILCWTPRIYLPAPEHEGSLVHLMHLDKIVHAGIFAVFAVLWLRTSSGRPRDYLLVLLAGAALALLTEAVQNHPFINREGELADGLTDVAGAIAGFPIYRFVEARYQRWSASNRRTADSRAFAVEDA
ncbi:VanZ like family protein [Aquisphaera giovannonii]|uniref:VanZ like family protein n=1 Tax=Aquisphaera giovannonii TaxID=406548 RepID=A0A5B9W0G3_9BACT|nr:hypothetical protein [Aquisphaera giovannonii]QEH33757.1 VanZ like family protein [Aquisphaera giovannonii]